MSRISLRNMDSTETPAMISLRRMFKHSHNYSSNSEIPRYEKSSSPAPFRWKVNESPPILKRPSTIKIMKSEKKLSYDPQTITINNNSHISSISAEQKLYSSTKSQRVYTKISNGQYLTHRPREYSGRTSIEQYEKSIRDKNSLLRSENNMGWSNNKLVVPRLWKALRPNKPQTKKKKSQSNIKELLIRNFIQFDDDFLFNK